MVRENRVLCLFGGKGKGKSTLAREIIRECSRVVILDAHGEYGADYEEDPIIGCESAWEMEESVALLREAGKRDRFCVSLRVTDDEEALRLWDVVWEIPGHLLVVEESSRFCSPAQLPREVARILRFGRHRGISQLYIAQRPSMVHRDVTANADAIIAFRQHEPRDMIYLRAVAGVDVNRLRILPDYKVMVFGDVSKVPLPVASRTVATASVEDQMGLDFPPEPAPPSAP